jgi:hypothetical protein
MPARLITKEKIRLHRSEKLAVRASIKTALHFRAGPSHNYYTGLLHGIQLMCACLSYSHTTVRAARRWEKLAKILEKANQVGKGKR